MVEGKFFVPHAFQSRGSGVAIDLKTPNVGTIYFDIDGSARYRFAMPRRDLARLARAIQRKLDEVPPASRRRKPQP